MQYFHLRKNTRNTIHTFHKHSLQLPKAEMIFVAQSENKTKDG